MRIDYCPKCKVAGLRYCSNYREIEASNWPLAIEKQYAPEGYGTAKWCPRCKEWVKPENHPYVRAGEPGCCQC